MVGSIHSILIVFYDDQRVAHISQVSECTQQLVVVSLVKPNGRLVQNIQYADETRSYLSSQADALRFTTGQRACGTRQCQISEPHLFEKMQPLPYLFGDKLGNLLLPGSQLQVVKEFDSRLN